jgi:hypothetical protein
VQGLENGGRASGIVLPETAETRARLRGELYAPAASFGALRERVYTQADGRRVQLRLETQGEHLYYLFLAESSGLFPVAGRGNYVVKKSLADGQFVQIKVFLRDHPGCFLRLYPAGGKSLLEVVLFGVRVYKDVPVALPLESWLTEPLSRLMKLSAALVDWGRLLEGGPVRGEPPAVARIRAALPTLPDGEDGALNERGALVLIESGEPAPAGGGLNCSGFAKWVVDGFRLGRRAPMLAIEPLKAKHMDLRGNRWSLPLEDRRDPYFGLDWSRNLAASAWALEGLAAQDPEEFDVRREEFLRYREDVGFPVEELELLSFLEASDSPGEYYLGSVNTDYGGGPNLRQHVHLVVLFPYFSAAGELRVAVFERGRETSLAAVAARYPGSYVHLVRLPAGASFLAPGFVRSSPLDPLPSVR